MREFDVIGLFCRVLFTSVYMVGEFDGIGLFYRFRFILWVYLWVYFRGLYRNRGTCARLWV